MRLALAATCVAAVAAVPLAIAAGASMPADRFLSAVRCVAYQEAQGVDVGLAKNELYWEAHRQSPETVAEAIDAYRDIAASGRPSGVDCGSGSADYEA